MDPNETPPPLPHNPVVPPPPPYNPPPYDRHRPAPERPRRGGTGWKIAAVLLGLMLLLSLFGNFLAVIFAGASGGDGSVAPAGYMEVVTRDNGSRNKIAIVHMEGVIGAQSSDSQGYNMVESLKEQLRSCRRDSDIKAVILKVDSPGGEVLAADEISRAIEDFQKKTGKPVIASMGSMAASGGYYVSAPCRWIVANELTMTGSIGVIMSGYNWRGLMDKLGVQPMVFKSGKLKDMLSPSKPLDTITDEEKAIVQDIINTSYKRFKEVVRTGRDAAADENGGEGRVLTDGWEEYADGRILTGQAAYDIGLVDELGNFDTAVDRARRLAGISDANLISFQPPFRFGSLFRLLGTAESNTVKIDLGVDLPKLEAGRLYFLPPFLMQ